MAERPRLSFDAAVADFAVSKEAYLRAHPDAQFDLIATCALVVDTAVGPKPRVLLLQRAASDSMPNKWEPPGGACDDADVSILEAAARELREETGLCASHVSGVVGAPGLFTIRSGRRVCRFNFSVRVQAGDGALPAVTLDPKEHQNYVWATEEEIKARKAGDIHLAFTSVEVERIILQALMEAGGTQMPG